MKYYLVAGERSGDLHGSNLIKAIRASDPEATFRAWGGDLMQAAGATLVRHYADMAFMGFWEVAKNFWKISGFLKHCKQDLLAYQPDAVILIDYAGFNMRVAAFAKSHGIKTLYYISPKVWAWNQQRALKLKQHVDQLYVIFPFEKAFFKRFDYDVQYVGNPLLDAVAGFVPQPNFIQNNQLGQKPIIALLPGSRKQEVAQMLANMLAVAHQFPDYQLVVAGVSNLPRSLYDSILKQTNVKIVFDAAYDLLSVATAALVTSGTATLETALFDVPQVVCYKSGWLSYQIGKRVIRVPYISLVNLIADQEVVKELIQYDLTPENIAQELQSILPPQAGRTTQLDHYKQIREQIGSVGASARAGNLMVAYLKSAV